MGGTGQKQPGSRPHGEREGREGHPTPPGTLEGAGAQAEHAARGRGWGVCSKAQTSLPRTSSGRCSGARPTTRTQAGPTPAPSGSRGRDINSLPFLLQVSLFK